MRLVSQEPWIAGFARMMDFPPVGKRVAKFPFIKYYIDYQHVD
jgi:hypothetical protein